MAKPLKDAVIGDRVVAKRRVYDLPGPDFGPPTEDMVARFGEFSKHIHAEKGESGIVVGTDENRVQVRFDRTKTSTDVVEEEVEVE